MSKVWGIGVERPVSVQLGFSRSLQAKKINRSTSEQVQMEKKKMPGMEPVEGLP